MSILIFYDMMEIHKPRPSGEERTSKVTCVSPPLIALPTSTPASTPKGAFENVAKEGEESKNAKALN